MNGDSYAVIKKHVKYFLAFAVPIFFAVVCLRFSSLVLIGFEDCTTIDRLSHTIPPLPRPENCADGNTLMSRYVLQFIGIGLFLVPIALAAVLIWRGKQSEELEVDSILIP